MFRILVVDDQAKIREGIKVILMSQNDNMEVDTASNGVDALEIMRCKAIHLVITDIRMPGMDGVALMEFVSHQYPEIPFFVISGYDDFSYAQKAIQYGAKAYLLKPLERKDLLQAVNRIYQQYQMWQKQGAEKQWDIVFAEQLYLFLHGNNVGPRVMEQVEREYHWLNETYQMVLFGFPERDLDNLEKEAYIQLARQIAQRMTETSHLLLRGERELILIVKEGEDLDKLMQDIRPMIVGSASVSDCYQGGEHLQRAYAQAREIYVHHFLFPEKCLLRQVDIEPLKKDFTVPYRDVERIRDIIGSCPDAEIVKYISQIFDRSVLCRYRIGYTLALCDSLYRNLRIIEAPLRENGVEAGLDIHKTNSPMEFFSMTEYLLSLQERMLRLNRLMREYKIVYRENAEMEEAIAYIRKNYYKQLTLAMVSNEVSLNYAYFSNAFRKYTGKTFMEFLRDIRIEEGKRLLAETDYKIGQIAEMVGYDSYKSLARVFKEEVGISPVEYRKQQQILKRE